MTLGVRAIVERGDGKILLVRHTYVSGLFLPGGGVEKAETAYAALRRELKEEGGVQLEQPAGLVGIYSNHGVFPNDHVLLYRIGPGGWAQGQATSTGEIAERLWVDPLSLPAGVTPGTARRLAEVFDGGPNDGYW